MAIKNQGIVQRKNDHLDIILNTPQDVTGASTGFIAHYRKLITTRLIYAAYSSIKRSVRHC